MAKSAVASAPARSRGKYHKKRVYSICNKLAEERGITSQRQVEQALCELRDNYGVPLIIIFSAKGDNRDRNGVDLEIRGKNPLHARFGIDVKSSRYGVREYQEKQRELQGMGIRFAYPRYPFLFSHQADQELQYELLKLILEKSENCQHFAESLPPYEYIQGDGFEENMRYLVKSIFS